MAFRARCAGLADNSEGGLRHAVLIELLPKFAVAANSQLKLFGKGINNRYANTVQSTGNLVAVVVEFAAGVQHRHNHFRRRNPFAVHFGRYATAVIRYADGLAHMDNHANLITVPRKRLIDRVVHKLEHHMMQACAVIGVADIHTRALAHRI